MTTEQKAKAYDKAIEELRGLLEGVHEEKCDIMEEDIIKIFPELKEKESEDERKELIDLVRHSVNCMPADKFNERIAWLEKQGEQKPVEWDESIIDETISLINMLASGYGEKVDEPITFNGVKMINNIKERLRAIKPQPRQEWSEEDKAMINNLYQVIDDHIVISGDTRRMFCSWLESLKDRVQPKQEWSEEDERMFKSLNKLLNEASCYSCTEGVDKILSWLKSLKQINTWKPSKEQIMALRWILSTIPYNIHKEEISGLLDQIKVL